MPDLAETYEVHLVRPEGVSVAEMKEYIRDAVGCWCRGGCPTDPIWEVAEHPISVRRLKNTNTNC